MRTRRTRAPDTPSFLDEVGNRTVLSSVEVLPQSRPTPLTRVEWFPLGLRGDPDPGSILVSFPTVTGATRDPRGVNVGEEKGHRSNPVRHGRTSFGVRSSTVGSSSSLSEGFCSITPTPPPPTGPTPPLGTSPVESGGRWSRRLGPRTIPSNNVTFMMCLSLYLPVGTSSPDSWDGYWSMKSIT